MLDDRIKEATSGGESSTSRLLTTLTPPGKEKGSNAADKGTSLPQSLKQREVRLVKSPSDTTIYAPALKKGAINKEAGMLDVSDKHNGEMSTVTTNHAKSLTSPLEENSNSKTMHKNHSGEQVMRHISEFVDQLTVESDRNTDKQEEQCYERLMPKSRVMVPGLKEAQKRAEQVVIESEKFKAAVEMPSGRNFCFTDKEDNDRVSPTSDVMRCQIGLGLSDDDFFHLTCHIDVNMKQKIENGCYVDLDKLLPKEKEAGQQYSDETKLEWVQSKGSTYLVPVKKMSRINCFRRWEQAFRMYATIYCGKNPNRSREIWQYISVINTASMAYSWDNVYNYDVIFRQLMEFNPARSWAVTYNQMWNLSMTNPINGSQGTRRGGSFQHQNFSNQQYGQSSSTSGNRFVKKKNDYCWSFNKEAKCKFGKRCKFIERCSYCDSPSHGVTNCNKLDKKDKEMVINGMAKKRNK